MKYPCNTYFISTSRAVASLIDDCIICLLLLLQDGTFASFGLDDVFSVTKTTDFDEFNKIQKKVRKNYLKKNSKNYFNMNNHFQIKEGKGGITKSQFLTGQFVLYRIYRKCSCSYPSLNRLDKHSRQWLLEQLSSLLWEVRRCNRREQRQTPSSDPDCQPANKVWSLSSSFNFHKQQKGLPFMVWLQQGQGRLEAAKKYAAWI